DPCDVGVVFETSPSGSLGQAYRHPLQNRRVDPAWSGAEPLVQSGFQRTSAAAGRVTSGSVHRTRLEEHDVAVFDRISATVHWFGVRTRGVLCRHHSVAHGTYAIVSFTRAAAGGQSGRSAEQRVADERRESSIRSTRIPHCGSFLSSDG